MSPASTGTCRRRRATALAIVTALAGLASLGTTHPAEGLTADSVVRLTLDEITAHGWNPSTGGLYINWSVDDPSVVNQPDGTVGRHDGLTDLRDLLNMMWYERRHPGDTSQSAGIGRLAPMVQTEFSSYSSDKGWVYWQLLHLADLGAGPAYLTAARSFATRLAGRIDPATGIDHGPLSASTAEAAASCPDGYRVDHDLESGLALVDAGARFQNPTWSALGAHEVDVVISQTFDAAHHLFDRIVCQGAVWDTHAKLGEQADEITALLDAGTYTGNAADIARAEQMLDVLAGPAWGLHDTAGGGYFFSLDLATGAVSNAYKESRQLTLLADFHRADLLTHGRYAASEAEMTRVALQMFTQAPLSGYPYREPPSYGFFGRERWITTESAGIALEALQTVLAPLPATAPPRPAARPVAPRPVPVPVPQAPAPAPATAVPAAPAPATAEATPVPATAAPAPEIPPAPPATAVRAPAPSGGFPWGLVALAAALALAAADGVRRLLRRGARS